MLTLPSCLVDDPPPFPESKQTPPRLDYHDALPLLDQVILSQTGETITFKIPVASEDAGESLSAQLFLDYNGGRSSPVVPGTSIRPSTLDDTSRLVQLDWSVLVSKAGCHRLTLRVTHSGNVDINNSPLVLNPDDLAEAYWWANIDVDPTLGNALADCPLASRGATP